MAAGHGVSSGLFLDQRLEIILFVRPFPVHPVADNGEENKTDAGNEDIRQRDADCSPKAIFQKAGHQQYKDHNGIQHVHEERHEPVDDDQDLDSVF